MNTKGSKHLDLSNRSFIEQGLNNNSSKTSIAEVIGMDKSSVCIDMYSLYVSLIKAMFPSVKIIA